jgi:DNA-binding transcriptional ArsR family regulator
MGLTATAELDRLLAALADPNRRRVVELLHERPLRAGGLDEALGLNPSPLSTHFARERPHRGIAFGFDARVRIFRLAPSRWNI